MLSPESCLQLLLAGGARHHDMDPEEKLLDDGMLLKQADIIIMYSDMKQHSRAFYYLMNSLAVSSELQFHD